MATKASKSTIKERGGRFTVITSPHDQRLVVAGWTHIGVDAENNSYFETTNIEAVDAAINSCGCKLEPAPPEP